MRHFVVWAWTRFAAGAEDVWAEPEVEFATGAIGVGVEGLETHVA